jgi:uncharacterized protein (DUF849 family)
MIQVTPTGPWGRDHHPRLPITVADLCRELAECEAAGAGGVHLHVRDDTGAETLGPEFVAATCAAVRETVGADFEIGVSTGAWIVPDARERAAVIREWEGVDCASVNLAEDGYEHVMAALHDIGIGIDACVWSPVELPRLVASGHLPHVQRVSIEVVPGRRYGFSGDPMPIVREINDLLDEAGSAAPRLTHSIREWTWDLVRDAFERGHATRVGFEDSTLLPDGSVAESNAALVRAAVEICAAVAIRDP